MYNKLQMYFYNSLKKRLKNETKISNKKLSQPSKTVKNSDP